MASIALSTNETRLTGTYFFCEFCLCGEPAVTSSCSTSCSTYHHLRHATKWSTVYDMFSTPYNPFSITQQSPSSVTVRGFHASCSVFRFNSAAYSQNDLFKPAGGKHHSIFVEWLLILTLKCSGWLRASPMDLTLPFWFVVVKCLVWLDASLEQ